MSRRNIRTRSKKLRAEELLGRNQLAEAHEVCAGVCRTDRTDAEAWTLLALIERRLGNHPEAESSARRAIALRPGRASAHQVLGTALQCQGRLAEAIHCYREAIRLAPSDTQSHYLLANALRETNEPIQADRHYARAIELQPDFLQALSNRGALLIALGKSEDAIRYLNRANKLQPGLPQVLCNFAQVMHHGGRFDEAKGYCRQVLQRDPDFVDAIAILAELCEKSHETEETSALVTRGLNIAPENISLNLTAARLARRERRYADGIALLEALRARLPESLQSDALLLLGQLYDKIGDSARAFDCLKEGNYTKASSLLPEEHSGERYLRRIENLRSRFRADHPESWTPFTGDDFTDDPIFLLGFPRSGTTLLEQILDSHPRLQTLDEKPAVTAMEQTFLQITPGRTAPYATLTLEEANRLRAIYFDTAARYLKRDPQRILVDKLPLNTVQAHLIYRVFPQAKVILTIRHPCDVCLSCFMQNFSVNEAMVTFFSLERTAEAYAGVMSLWREYVAVLPIDYHRIRYEDLVADQAGETQRLLTFLGLEWNDNVLRYDEHARKRDINTPSYHQVTKPIYQDAKYRWKRYQAYMQAVLPILQPYIDYFGYGEDT